MIKNVPINGDDQKIPIFEQNKKCDYIYILYIYKDNFLLIINI